MTLGLHLSLRLIRSGCIRDFSDGVGCFALLCGQSSKPGEDAASKQCACPNDRGLSSVVTEYTSVAALLISKSIS